jgi:hypothetical protein
MKKRELPKGFRDQYIECKKQGMVTEGSVQKFKDHPDLLPAFWHPAAPKIAKKLKEDPEFGLASMMCLRFGGECNSGHPQCRKMRGFIEKIEKPAC